MIFWAHRLLAKFHTMFSHTASQEPNAVAIVISICCCLFLVLKTSVRVVWFVCVWKISVRMGPPKNEWLEIMISFQFHTLHCMNQLWMFHEPIVGVSWSFCGMGRFCHLSRLVARTALQMLGVWAIWVQVTFKHSELTWQIQGFLKRHALLVGFVFLIFRPAQRKAMSGATTERGTSRPRRLPNLRGTQAFRLFATQKKKCVPILTNCSLSHYPRLIISFRARILNLDIPAKLKLYFVCSAPCIVLDETRTNKWKQCVNAEWT